MESKYRILVKVRQITDLTSYIDKEKATATIKNNIYFRGPNVYVLAFAIIMASIGLNVNSIPVIIGAMLISPLMGPIIGVGYGLGTSDTETVKSAMKNFAIMVGISIVVSTIIFTITPLKLGEPTELLARTKPTFYDVLIAIVGGFAGTLEICRNDEEKEVVLSGVAIATALMPPLCTVGYGIAELNIHYIGGALYLFIINCCFIALASYLTIKILGFTHALKTDDDSQKRYNRKLVVITFLAILIAPSGYTLFNVIRENNFSSHAEALVSKYKTIGGSYVFDHKIDMDSKPFTVEIFIAGEGLTPEQKEFIYIDGETAGINRNQIIFREEAADNVNQSSTEVIRGIYEYYDKRIQELNQTIMELQIELAKYKPALPAPADSTAAGYLAAPADSSAL